MAHATPVNQGLPEEHTAVDDSAILAATLLGSGARPSDRIGEKGEAVGFN